MPMTKQEVFDTVATHLLTQKAKSENDDIGYYMYRGDDGRKCAVGCLIPDEAYEPRFERLDIGRKMSNSMVSDEYFAERQAAQKDLNECVSRIFPDLAFLRELQKIHDNYRVMSWRRELDKLAKEHELSPVVLETL